MQNKKESLGCSLALSPARGKRSENDKQTQFFVLFGICKFYLGTRSFFMCRELSSLGSLNLVFFFLLMNSFCRSHLRQDFCPYPFSYICHKKNNDFFLRII